MKLVGSKSYSVPYNPHSTFLRAPLGTWVRGLPRDFEGEQRMKVFEL